MKALPPGTRPTISTLDRLYRRRMKLEAQLENSHDDTEQRVNSEMIDTVERAISDTYVSLMVERDHWWEQVRDMMQIAAGADQFASVGMFDRLQEIEHLCRRLLERH